MGLGLDKILRQRIRLECPRRQADLPFNPLQSDEHGLARPQPRARDDDRQHRARIGGAEKFVQRIPFAGVRDEDFGVGEKHSREVHDAAVQDETVRAENKFIAAALLGLELEELADRFRFAADVTAAPAAHAVRTAERAIKSTVVAPLPLHSTRAVTPSAHASGSTVSRSTPPPSNGS